MMMFLGFLPLACWTVTMGTFIGTNTGREGSGAFGEGFVGIAYTTGAIGALFAPLLIGGIADRYFSAERILAVDEREESRVATVLLGPARGSTSEVGI